ncbi:MAG: PilT/PilU family type 4a pilus ATPase [bacterium]|nr:PilT/PilU family type 4a pilus ATPase [bacterium]
MPFNIDELLGLTADKKASDLYLVVGSPPIIRVQGTSSPLELPVLTPKDTQEIAESIMTADQKRIFVADPEINLAYAIPGIARFRGNIYKQRGTVAIVFRQVRTDIPTIEELRLPPILKQLALELRGLILITGAAGSGKSTTLAAMIGYRNQEKTGHIITLEDPIEFLHTNKKSLVSQREVGSDTISFEKALQSVLRQSPDVILIGEMRNTETVSAAINFAETGHLVLSTLHSTNANQTMERILQFFSPHEHNRIYTQLSYNLKAILSQRLVPRADGSGRVAALEIMLNTPRIADILRKGEILQLKTTIAAGTKDGMQTFDQAIFELYKSNIITLDDAMLAADSPNDLKLRIRGMTSG